MVRAYGIRSTCSYKIQREILVIIIIFHDSSLSSSDSTNLFRIKQIKRIALKMPSETIPLSILPPLAECFYCTCYCEENVWKLCESVQKHFPNELSRSYAVFISNNDRKVPLWTQKQSPAEEIPIVWDYHVVMVHMHPTEGSQVYDMDTILPFPVDFNKYITVAVGSNERLMDEFYRFFRVIPAQEFLDTLASDRSHMLKENGEYKSPPPAHPCMVAKDGTTMNLDSFISMEKGTGYGEVMTLEEFTTKFTEPCS